jgi:hypothetical protein
MLEVEPLNFTRTFRSFPIIMAGVLIPLFVVLALAYWILDFLAGLGLATGFAANYIGMLQNIVATMDFLVPFTFAVMFGAVAIRSFQTKTHPVLGVLGLIFIPVAVLLTGYLSNVVALLEGFSFFSTIFNEFGYTITFFRSSPLIIGAASILILLIMVGGGVLARR